MSLPTRSRRTWIGALLAAAMLPGCSAPGEEFEEVRRSANLLMGEALTLFAAKDYPAADAKFTSALDVGGLNPDMYCEAIAKRAVCWAAAKRYAEALAELENLGPAAPQDQVLAARSFILRKQGKAAEARAAFAKAKRLNPSIKEFPP